MRVVDLHLIAGEQHGMSLLLKFLLLMQPLLMAFEVLWIQRLRVPVLVQTYIHNGLTYVSQLLHNVRVTGLPYGQTIYYK